MSHLAQTKTFQRGQTPLTTPTEFSKSAETNVEAVVTIRNNNINIAGLPTGAPKEDILAVLDHSRMAITAMITQMTAPASQQGITGSDISIRKE